MKAPWRERLASWNRYLALAGGILFLGGLATLLVLGGGFLPGSIVLVVGLLLLLAAWLVNPGAVRGVLSSRSARYGGILALMSLSLLGILVLLNVLSYRYYARWDLTEEGLFSISAQTRKVLDQVNQPVRITGFFYRNPDTYGDQSAIDRNVRDLVAAYAAYNRQISYTSVDPEARPSLAEQYGIPRGGRTLVVESGDRKQLLSAFDEQAITSAILNVVGGREVTVYVVTGHGERDFLSNDPEGYGRVHDLLLQAGYQVGPLELGGSGGGLPLTDAVVVLAGPRSELLPAEEQALVDYLSQGGKVLFLLDPGYPALDAVLDPWGVLPKDSRVVDPEYGLNGDPEIPLVYWPNPDHPVSEDLPVALFPGVRPLDPLPDLPAGVVHAPLLITSEFSWDESNLDERPPVFDPAVDRQGPLALALALWGRLPGSDQASDTRIVIVGDSDFAANGYYLGGNPQLFFNAVNWLAGKEELIEVATIQPKERLVLLTGAQIRGIRYATLVGMPLLVIGVGVVVWLRRRKG